MAKRLRHRSKPTFRFTVEPLEARELLSNLLGGRAATDESGSAAAPLGNVLDDVDAGLVGADFAISAPSASPSSRSGAGEVYVIFGQAGLDSIARQGCFNRSEERRVGKECRL